MYRHFHTVSHSWRKLRRRRLVSGLMLIGLSPALLMTNGLAAQPDLSGGVSPACDETYYAMLDYYGSLQEGSVVKSYRMNGAAELTDYGNYDEVSNLTDGTEPAAGDGKVVFSFDGESAPDRFYFEGKTAEPFSSLPWTLGLSYQLNGVKKNAEELAGESGLVEIDIDAVPNDSASEYSRNNFVLQAIAVFNDDDILSLEAPGAQVQLIGNLRVVLFMALPGEQQNFAIRVGSEDFTFAGVTFMMVPATLSQLGKIADLRDAKDDAEDSYNDISDSMDSILNSLDGMSSSLYSVADGLDGLNGARENISEGKGGVYDSADAALSDLLGISAALEPMNDDLTSASQAITDITDVLTELAKNAASLKDQLAETRTLVSKIQEDNKNLRKIIGEIELYTPELTGEAEDLRTDLRNLGGNLESLQTSLAALRAVSSKFTGLPAVDEYTYDGMTIDEIESYVATAKNYHTQYEQYLSANGLTEAMLDFKTFLIAGGASEADAEKLSTLYALSKTDDFNTQIEQAETINSLIGNVNDYITEINTILGALSSPTDSLLTSSGSLCGTLGDDGLSGDLDDVLSTLLYIEDILDDHDGDLTGAMKHLDELGSLADKLTKNADTSIDLLDTLDSTVNDYVPKAQQSLSDIQTLDDTAITGITDAHTFLRTLESLMKESGAQLDDSLEKTLESLSDTLRRSASGLGNTNNIKDAKGNIDDVIQDEWDAHTGEDDNMLNMDSEASPVSLTSALNAAPSSVQVLIRTQEIKKADAETGTGETEPQPSETGTFFSRVAAMFEDFWSGLTRLLHIG